MDSNITYRWKFFRSICHRFYAVSRFVVHWLKMQKKSIFPASPAVYRFNDFYTVFYTDLLGGGGGGGGLAR